MDENLFRGIYTLAFAAACLIISWALGWRSQMKGKKCTERTVGTVINYSFVQYNGFSLPVVQYIVDGNFYKVVGPKFKAGITSTISTPFHSVKSALETNITSKENLPDVLKVKVHRNSIASITHSPLMDLYPVDTQVNVYYNPEKPKVSYVQRYVGFPIIFAFWIPLIAGIILLISGLFIIFGLEINYDFIYI